MENLNACDHSDVFIRELLSNSNDALEKTRLLSLTDPTILTPAPQLNITVLVDAPGGRIVIRGESFSSFVCSRRID